MLVSIWVRVILNLGVTPRITRGTKVSMDSGERV